MADLTEAQSERLARIVREPFYVYSPSSGGGSDYAELVKAGFICVADVGDAQETVLFVSATDAGRATHAKLKESGGMRTGDRVFHRPSGEKWLVAWADHKTGYMAPCGWPTCQARIVDCDLLESATDEECDALVASLARSGRSDAMNATAIRDRRSPESTHG